MDKILPAIDTQKDIGLARPITVQSKRKIIGVTINVADDGERMISVAYRDSEVDGASNEIASSMNSAHFVSKELTDEQVAQIDAIHLTALSLI